MFDIGLGEFAALLVIAVFIFGPDKLPDLARQAGRAVRQARKLVSDTRSQVADELGPEYANFDPRDLDPRRLIHKHVLADLEDDDEEEEAARAAEAEDVRPGHRPLGPGERAPYDAEAT